MNGAQMEYINCGKIFDWWTCFCHVYYKSQGWI